MIDLARTQDEEVGDGTTSVIILGKRKEREGGRGAGARGARPPSLLPSPAGELLAAAEPFLAARMHPTVIIRGYTLAAEAALDAVRSLAFDVDTADRASMLTVLNACIGTKFTSRFGPLLAELALDAVSIVATPSASGGPPDVDVKRYAKVEKLPGGDVSDCRVLKGVMFNKVG